MGGDTSRRGGHCLLFGEQGVAMCGENEARTRHGMARPTRFPWWYIPNPYMHQYTGGLLFCFVLFCFALICFAILLCAVFAHVRVQGEAKASLMILFPFVLVLVSALYEMKNKKTFFRSRIDWISKGRV